MIIAGFCDKDTAIGLRLAGIHNLYIPNGNAVQEFDKIKEQSDIGILLITEKIAKDISKYLKDFRLQNETPIIIEIPDKSGYLEDHIDFVSHLIKKAVGIDVSKN